MTNFVIGNLMTYRKLIDEFNNKFNEDYILCSY